jgi:hypothetical protein
MEPELRQPDVTSHGGEVTRSAGERTLAYGHKAALSADVALASLNAALGISSVTGTTGASFQIPIAKPNVVVGEPITLDLTGRLFLGRILMLLSGSFLKSVTWQIPGKVVKAYSQGHSKTRVVPLSQTDRSAPKIIFYWVDPGGPRKVQAKCVVFSPLHKADITFTFSATFVVQAPKLAYLRDPRRRADRGKTRIGSNRAAAKGLKLLEFTGRIRKRAQTGIRRLSGTEWDWKVTIPPGHDGKIKDLQTIYGIREQTVRPAVDAAPIRSVWKIPGKPLVSIPGHGPAEGYRVVDSNPIEDPGEPRYSGEFPIDLKGGTSTKEITGQDSPDEALNSDLGVRYFVHETFKYFVLFRPNTAGAIWVPVGKVEWFWRGEAVRDKGRWKLQAPAGGILSPGAATTQFPEYDDHTGKLTWVDLHADE